MPPRRDATGKLSDEQLRAALAAIDPAWAPPPPSRFERQVAQGASAVPDLKRQLADQDPVTRADAAAALGRLRAKGATAELKALLADPFPPVRQAAAAALLRIGDRQLLNEFVKALKEPNPKVVVGAATALGESDQPDVVPYLIETLRTTNPLVASGIARALGKLRAQEAVQWLVAALSANFIPAAACEALGRIGDGAAAPALLKALPHPDADVRAAAARALGLLAKSTSPRFDPITRDGKALPALRALAKDSSPKVRLCAAIARLELGDEPAAAELKATLEASVPR